MKIEFWENLFDTWFICIDEVILMLSFNKLVVFASTAFLIVGCSTNYVKPQNYTAFLPDYSKLKKVEMQSKNDALVWSKDNVQQYSKVIYTPIRYSNLESDTQNTANISQDARKEILNYTNTQIQNALGQHFTLTNQADKKTLIFQGTISKISTDAKHLKPYEYLPIMLVKASTQYALGSRDRDTEIYFEGKFLDASSKQPVYEVVMKVQGKPLENDKSQLSVADVKKAIDGLASDIASFKTNAGG